MLDELRELAFRFQIDPDNTEGHAASISSVVNVLNNINQSFQNFLEVEFFKNEKFVKAFEQNEKVLGSLKVDLKLLLVDVKFGSFEAAAVPNLVSLPSLFNNEVMDWKKDTYREFKENVLFGDFENPKFLNKVMDKYTESERNKIFKPLFSSVSSDYKLNLIDKNSKKTFKQPSKGLYDYYVTKVEKKTPPNESEYKTVQLYAQIRKDEDGFNLAKKNIKQVYYLEELEHETYPYKPNSIVFENTAYSLNKKVDCQVDFEDNMYVIQNNEFDITVWGNTREEAEYSFSFTFHSLYQNYAVENDAKLSSDAKKLKENLLKIVKKVINEG
jgi:hypothetical protein